MDALISRKAAINAVEKESQLDGAYGYMDTKSIIDLLNNLPSITQPERKQGHWEIYVISMFDGEGCKCSECSFEGMPHWVSCPNCDARMEGVKNETD